MKTINQPKLGLIVATLVYALLQADANPYQPYSAAKQISIPRTIPLKFDEAISIKMKSHGVAWKNGNVHLVNLSVIEFSLDESKHLKATIDASIQTFDNVDYDVSVAVLSESDSLLGVARANCEVPRQWLGRMGMTPRTLELDFGVSLDYPQAAKFLISISKQQVLTPDEWQKRQIERHEARHKSRRNATETRTPMRCLIVGMYPPLLADQA